MSKTFGISACVIHLMALGAGLVPAVPGVAGQALASDQGAPQADDPSPAWTDCDQCSMSFHMDQDLFLPIPSLNEDRDYTMGLMLSWNGRKPHKYSRYTYDLLDIVHAPLEPFMLGFPDKYFTTSIGISAYTPDDLRRSDIILDDRPYASLLYLTSSEIHASPTGNQAIETSMTFGFFGLPFAEWSQTALHKLYRATTGDTEPFDPKGWHNQVSDGGEPTLMYKASWYNRLPLEGLAFVDLAYSAELNMGYMTGASLGFVTRLGRIDKTTPVWNVVNGVNYQSNTNQFAAGRNSKSQLFWQMGARISYVAYNAFLQCQFRRSNRCLSADEVKDIVVDISMGIGVSFGQGQAKNLLWTCNSRSEEHTLASKRVHHWCGINFNWRL